MLTSVSSFWGSKIREVVKDEKDKLPALVHTMNTQNSIPEVVLDSLRSESPRSAKSARDQPRQLELINIENQSHTSSVILPELDQPKILPRHEQQLVISDEEDEVEAAQVVIPDAKPIVVFSPPVKQFHPESSVD